MYEASEDIFFCAYSYLFDQFDFICLENPRDGGAWWAAIYGYISLVKFSFRKNLITQTRDQRDEINRFKAQQEGI